MERWSVQPVESYHTQHESWNSTQVCVPVSHWRDCDAMILLQGKWPSEKGYKQAPLPVSSLPISLLVRSVCCLLADVGNNRKLDLMTQGHQVGERTLFFKSSFQWAAGRWLGLRKVCPCTVCFRLNFLWSTWLIYSILNEVQKQCLLKNK